jgi:hypothetical protein
VGEETKAKRRGNESEEERKWKRREETKRRGEETKAKRRNESEEARNRKRRGADIYDAGANNHEEERKESEEEGVHTMLVQTINLHGLASVSSMKDDPGNCSPLYSSWMIASILAASTGPKTLL